MDEDRYYSFMNASMDCAREAMDKFNLPVGAVLVIDGNLVDRAYNSNDINNTGIPTLRS